MDVMVVVSRLVDDGGLWWLRVRKVRCWFSISVTKNFRDW